MFLKTNCKINNNEYLFLHFPLCVTFRLPFVDPLWFIVFFYHEGTQRYTQRFTKDIFRKRFKFMELTCKPEILILA